MSATGESLRALSESRDSREKQGLPKHPANGWITCPQCGGEGEIDVVWIAEDDYTSNACPQCLGDGDIQDGHIDPLIKLRAARHAWSIRCLRSAIKRFDYEHARRIAMRPVSGIASAEFRAQCTMVGNGARLLSATVKRTREQLFGVAA